MNKRQKEVIQYQLDSEKEVLEQLQKQYQRALNDIDRKIRILESDELTQSRVYRLEYQKALKMQVDGILEKLHSDEYTTIQQFLSHSYTDAFVGTVYDMFGQGVPFIMPIDNNAAVKAVLTDSKISEGLYKALGVDTKKLKNSISAEITRGIATGMPHSEIARNIASAAKAPLSRAKTIVRTESHRIKCEAEFQAALEAKSKGADILKQWDATLDGNTRPSHQKLDGEIKELEEKFSNGMMYPGDSSGTAAEVVNCRCLALTRARVALDEEELKTLQERAEFFGLDKTEDFEDFKKKYLKAAENVDLPLEKVGKSGIIISEKGNIISGKHLSDDLQERSKQIDSILNDFTSKVSKWSGTTRVLPRDDMVGVAGKKDWSCDIILREDAGVKTTIHEHLHARSVSHYNEIAFVRWYNAEEGAVELFAQAICNQNGIAYSESYKDIVKQLQIIHSITGEFEDEFSFAQTFYEVDLLNRYSWLRELADKAISGGTLSKATINALNNAVETFNRKM